MFEKLYLLHNPLTETIDWVSEKEFKIGSEKLKDVFGVLYLDDVKFMLKFNPKFKESIIAKYKLVNDNEIQLQHVCRMINLKELTKMLDMEAASYMQTEDDTSLTPSYPERIEVADGYFIWNDEKKEYQQAN